jgi:hypothetical protein
MTTTETTETTGPRRTITIKLTQPILAVVTYPSAEDADEENVEELTEDVARAAARVLAVAPEQIQIGEWGGIYEGLAEIAASITVRAVRADELTCHEIDLGPSECADAGALDAEITLPDGRALAVTLWPEEHGYGTAGTPLDGWCADPSALPADPSARAELVSAICEAVTCAVAEHSRTYRIEVSEPDPRDPRRVVWSPAPGDAHGWTLDAALRACHSGSVRWIDGQPVPRDAIRLVPEE